MIEPKSIYLDIGNHELHVTAWGDPANEAVVMAHGLARTGRDFDEAARELAGEYFVLCPDLIGRGLSSWAPNGAAGYGFDTYMSLLIGMLDHFGKDKVRWVGTSLGGLLGVTLAATGLQNRITHLVINDVGPLIPFEGTRRIAEYVNNPPIFDRVQDLEVWLRKIYTPFGENSDAFWRRMADTSARRTNDGRVTVHFDPQIVSVFGENKADLEIWGVYDLVTAKTLLIRGAHSDVLTQKVAEEMTRRGPKPRLWTIDDCGHAPTLTNAAQIEGLAAFLDS
jgi:pimeloyl-ACP methyl ester carboxylesterase